VRDYREIVLFGLIILVAIAVCFIFVFWQVDVSQHHWCDALNTLTQHPVPQPSNPNANPSRMEAYTLYREFVQIKGEFGCG